MFIQYLNLQLYSIGNENLLKDLSKNIFTTQMSLINLNNEFYDRDYQRNQEILHITSTLNEFTKLIGGMTEVMKRDLKSYHGVTANAAENLKDLLSTVKVFNKITSYNLIKQNKIINNLEKNLINLNDISHTMKEEMRRMKQTIEEQNEKIQMQNKKIIYLGAEK
jgi:hypothetical protein